MQIDNAMAQLKEQGYKFTAKRYDILSFLIKEARYVTAKEILEDLKDKHDGLSFDTIYRNLALFEASDLLEETELDGEKRFRIACSVDEHHHHLICLTCGKTEHIHHCPMDQKLISSKGFTVTGHKFEIYGYCPECVV
ncbi:Fur family transcriptional regulator [Salisediminibacterium beveridgei]|uniref:Zinc uptake regulation protein ZUR n=1 Tax=Salisediminibacterium beveridgei TaxID=632773 RepID=A0A1D7QUI3_9BACI|nr:Fur family transcriptional regulator [Salisediminibacterium beveridgei]AOM82618.1 Zinc uptake regulation protein ZUR [Salisediminibacterium beveridgei]